MFRLGKEIIRAEGGRALFAGVGISSIMGGPGSMLFWYTFEQSKYLMKYYFSDKYLMSISFSAAIIAEMVSCVIWLPVDVVKERLQVQNMLKTYHYKNSIDAVKQIAKNEGIPALYRAYGATIMSFGTFGGINQACYEKFKQMYGYKNDTPTFVESFQLAFTTGSFAALLTNPLDVAKVRMQIQRAELSNTTKKGEKLDLSKGRFGHSNVFDGMNKIYTNEGFFALWRGMNTRLVYQSSVAALNIALLETFRKIASGMIKEH